MLEVIDDINTNKIKLKIKLVMTSIIPGQQ